MWECFENPFVNDISLDPRPLPSLHMRRRCSALSHWSTRTILVPRARRFLATGRLQIKPSGSGDENAHVPTPRYGQYLTHAHNHITRLVAAMDSYFALIGAHQGYGFAHV